MALSDQFSDDKLGLKPGGPGKPLPAPPAAGATPATTAPADTTSNVPPLLSNIGSSALQGLRDIGLTVGQGAVGAGQWLDQNVPGMRALDVRTGITPEAVQSGIIDPLTAQTQAYETGPYAGSIPGMVARYGTQMAATAPLLGPLAEAVPAAAPGAALLARAAPLAAKGAIMGGGTNLLASGGMGENPLTAATTGAVGGAILGPATAGLGSVVQSANQGLIDAAKRIGVDLSVGQRMGGLASWVEDATKMNPFAGASKFAGQQQDQFANVIRREAGIGGSGALDGADIAAAKAQTGADIGSTAAGVSVPLTPQMLNAMQQVGQFATQAGPDQREAQVFGKLFSELNTRAQNNGGVLSGTDFQNFVQRGGPLDNALSSRDPDTRTMAQQFQRVLYDTASTNGQGAPDAVNAWRNARYRYKVLSTVEDPIAAAPNGTTDMSNAALARNIRNEFGVSPAQVPAGGSGAMQDLAQVMRGTQPLRSSGTAERLAYMGLLGAGGGGALWALQNPQEAERWAIGPGAGMVATGLLGRGMRFAPNLMMAPGAAAGWVGSSAPAMFGPWAGRAAGNLLGGNYQAAPGAPGQ